MQPREVAVTAYNVQQLEEHVLLAHVEARAPDPRPFHALGSDPPARRLSHLRKAAVEPVRPRHGPTQGGEEQDQRDPASPCREEACAKERQSRSIECHI